MEILLFLAGVFFLTLIGGKLLEKVKIPWLFSALIIGFILSIYNPYTSITNSQSFLFLANLGMLFLLFIIGFELDVKKILHQDKFVIKGAIVIILSEAIAGSFLFHYFFHTNWLTSLIVASSFATVGETVLLPILDEFKLTKTKLGRTILGIGVLDDVLELITIIAANILISNTAGYSNMNIWVNLGGLFLFFGLVYILIKYHSKLHQFKFHNIPSLFLFVLFFIFLFIGFGELVEAGALGAILAGIALKNIVPQKTLKYIDSEVRTLSYGFLSPIFFLWVGINTNFHSLLSSTSLFLILLVVFTTFFTKVLVTYLVGKKYLGGKESIVAGVGLTVKLSTSIVILKLLLDKGIIHNNLYSVLIASSVIFTILVPIIMPYLINRWHIHPNKKLA